MLYAFDLDGTLVDTRQAVLRAYMDVGVTPPDDFFVRPWHTWLTSYENNQAKHDAKNARYRELMHLVRPMPLLELFRELSRHNKVVLTGASKDAVHTIYTHFDIKCSKTLWGLTVDQKIGYMNSFGDRGIMFEDQLQAADKMRKETKWTICHTQDTQY